MTFTYYYHTERVEHGGEKWDVCMRRRKYEGAEWEIFTISHELAKEHDLYDWLEEYATLAFAEIIGKAMAQESASWDIDARAEDDWDKYKDMEI